MIQDTVWLITLILMAGVAATFVYVAINTTSATAEYTEIQARSGGLRRTTFWVLLIAVGVITGVTLQTLPYAASRGNFQSSIPEISVVGKKWYWEIEPRPISAGDSVIFNVSSADVNHGFGIYDENLNMLGQTQAMPGYENKLLFTFEQPGEYKLMCMEYCGLAHHAMITPLTVTTTK